MKSRTLLSVVALGLGLTSAVLFLLAHPTPVARADPGIYYTREGATGDCLAATTPCSSVQRAINLATTPGDEVWVATGTYTENLLITHSVKLRGGWDIPFTTQSPASTPTILDTATVTHNVRIKDAPLAKVTLEGLTLRNGQDGVHVWAGNVTVERCTIHDMGEQGLEIDGGTVLISATQILTVQRGIEVDDGLVEVANVHIAHTTEEGLLIEGGGTVTFTASTIEDCEQQGVQVNQGNLWLFDNLIHNIRADGIRIGGGVASVISNTIHNISSDGIDGRGQTVTITQNIIHDVGKDGVHIEDAGTAHVYNNTVYDTAEHGIYARGGDCTIANNTVQNIGGDGIRTHSTSTDVQIRNNTVYTASNDGIDARGDVITITHNTVSGCADNGIKTDDVSGRAHIEANWVLSNATVGIAIRQAPVFTLTNNVIGDHPGGSVELEGTGTGFLYHNTLVGSGTGAQGTGLAVLEPLAATIVNNVIVSHSVGITATPGATLIVSHTLLWHNGDDPISGTVVFPTPPLFVAPGQQNYHLLPDSPAVDAGIETGVTSDVDGDTRPIGALPDVGADEVRLRTFLPLVLRGY